MHRTVLIAALACCSGALAAADQFRILVMQAQKGDAAKYAPLAEYLTAKGIAGVAIEGAPGYAAAAQKFSAGEAEAMVAGSAVAGVLIIKELAEPVARPVSAAGVSTYRAVVVARTGAKPWDGKADYFAGKTVTCCALASSGEFFLRATLAGSAVKVEPAIAKSHGAAIEAVAREQAEVAIVKDAVWNKEKAKQPGLVQIGADAGENPDNTLVVARHTAPAVVAAVKAALFALEADASPQAKAVKDSLGAVRYVATTRADFAHTVAMLGKAGVGKDFSFKP